MRKILVTGGAGFIGANFVRYMLEKEPSSRVVVLDKLTYAGNLENLDGLKDVPGFAFVKGDIRDFGLVDSIFEKESIDTVVNFAAESHVDRSILGPGVFLETNVMGTFTLLEAARKRWPKDRGEGGGRAPGSGHSVPSGFRFLHVSTDEVYGSLGPEGLFTEETPYSPNSPYSASKAASDHLVRAYHHTYGLPVVTTNCSNNYGPYQFPEKLIPLMIINGLKGKPLPVYGDGKNVRDWLYVEDHCAAVALALAEGRVGETYNIGGRTEMHNIEIVRLVCSLIDGLVEGDAALKREYPLEGPRSTLIEFVKDRPGHDRRYAIDCTKIERELGFRPGTGLEEGLEKTVAWYVKNRAWWERIISGEYMEYYELQYKNR